MRNPGRVGRIVVGLAACRAEGEIASDVCFVEPPAPDEVVASSWLDDGPPNVLLVVADDVGVDLLATWEPGPDAAPTPTLDRLAREGVVFERTYASPWCSPTRAAVATGRHGRRHGLGRAIEPREERFALDPSAVTVAEVLRDHAPEPWSTAVVGKWHLSVAEGPDDLRGPLDHGFDHHRGTFANLARAHAFDRGPMTYESWERVTDGVLDHATGYVTSATVDDALSWIGARDDAPWLLWLGFHAAHTPWHVPPAHLHPYRDVRSNDTPTKIRAMVASLDTELGRLLDALPAHVRERTVVIFVADNGTTDNGFLGARRGRPGKSTVFEGGVRVPLIVSGPGVDRGRRERALVNTVDLFPTLVELAGVDPEELGLDLDGVSLGPLLRSGAGRPRRRLAYAEAFEPNGPGPYFLDDRTIRDDRHKLVRRLGKPDQLFELGDDVIEGEDLLARVRPTRAELEAWSALGDALDACGPRPDADVRPVRERRPRARPGGRLIPDGG